MSILKGILKANGMEPTPNEGPGPQQQQQTESSGSNNGQVNEDDEEKKKLAEQQQQQLKEEEEKKRLEQQQQGGADKELSDEELIAQLKKRGKNVSSLDDIDKPVSVEPTPEEKAQQEIERRNNIRAFGLRNKKVTSTLFDEYAIESSMNKIDLAFKLFREERLQDHATAKTPVDQIPSDKDLRAEFDETHFQFAEENDPKRIRQTKLLEKMADEYIEDKYSNILDLEEEYDSHQNTSVQRKNYSGIVDEAITSIGDEMKFTFPINDKETFDFTYKVSPESKEAMRKLFNNDASFSAFGKDVKKEKLAEAIRNGVTQQEFLKIIGEAAVAYGSKLVEDAKKGRRGIPPARKEEGSQSGEKAGNKTVQALLNQPENKKVVQPT